MDEHTVKIRIDATDSGVGRVFAAVAAKLAALQLAVKSMASGSEGDFKRLEGAATSAATGLANAFKGTLTTLASFASMGAKIGAIGFVIVAAFANIQNAVIALSGAMVSAIGQTLPVIGLLVAAFKRVGAAAQASAALYKEQQNAIQNATQIAHDHAAALYNIAQAQLGVADAQRQLTITRRDATRALEDLVVGERNARIAQEQAALGLASARTGLRSALQSGDVTAIFSADLRQQSAQVGAKSADTAAARASADLARAQRLGVDGSQAVVQANRAVAAATHNLAEANYQASQQTLALTAASRAALANLDPTEKKLVGALTQLRTTAKAAFAPITDAIVGPITRAVNDIVRLLKDPQIQGALGGLAHQIGISIGRFSEFLFGKKSRDAYILPLLRDATANLPTVTDILLKVAKALAEVGKAFNEAIGGPNGMLSSLSGQLTHFNDFLANAGTAPGAGNASGINNGVETRGRPAGQSPISSVIQNGLKQLSALGSLLGSTTHLVEALASLFDKSGGPTGGGIAGLADAIDQLATNISTNADAIRGFFGDLAGLLKTVADLGKKVDGIFKSLGLGPGGAALATLFAGIFAKQVVVQAVASLFKKDAVVNAVKKLFSFAGFGRGAAGAGKAAEVSSALAPLKGPGGAVIAAPAGLVGAEGGLAAGAGAGEAGALVAAGPGLLIVGAALLGIGAAAYAIHTNFLGIKDDIKAVWGKLSSDVEATGKSFEKLGNALTGGHLSDVLNAIGGAFSWVGDHIGPVLRFLGKLAGLAIIVTAASFFAPFIVTLDLVAKGLGLLADGATWVVKALISLGKWFNDQIHWITDLGGNVGGWIVDGISAALRLGVGIFDAIKGAFYDLKRQFEDLGSTVGHWIWNKIKDVIPHSIYGVHIPFTGDSGGGGGDSGGGAGGGATSSGRFGTDPRTGAAVGVQVGSYLGGFGDGTDSTFGLLRAGPQQKTDAAVAAATALDAANWPYAWGGGHNAAGTPTRAYGQTNVVTGKYEIGYDCSGSVYAVLRGAGITEFSGSSGAMMNQGLPAKGTEPIVVYANKNHAFLSLRGRDFTTGIANYEDGPGFTPHSHSGFVARKPHGFAGGAYFAGSMPGVDRHHVMVADDEAILNTQQINLVGRGRVMDALSATGAPSVGGAFARGKAPLASGIGFSVTDINRDLAYSLTDVAVLAGIVKHGTMKKLTDALATLSQGLTLIADTISAALQRADLKAEAAAFRVSVSKAGKVSVLRVETALRVQQAKLQADAAERLALLAEQTDAATLVRKAKHDLSLTKDPAKRKLLREAIAGLVSQQKTIQDALDQSTAKLGADVEAVTQAQVDAANRVASVAVNAASTDKQLADLGYRADARGNLIQTTSFGLPDIGGERSALQASRAAITTQSSTLRGLLDQAAAQGNTTLVADLTQQLKDNALALAQNTNEMRSLGQINLQSFSSTAWTMFRQATTNGLGGLLPGSTIPQLEMGGTVARGGLFQLHTGEVVSNPARGQGAPVNVVINQAGGDLDPAWLASRLSFEMKVTA